ncbi:MAG: hypothetical protein NUV35_00880, partial [Syntrophomonadaceae bacterium]|nr:hypothetical protein [Syntrophomonadaceae bacterium]
REFAEEIKKLPSGDLPELVRLFGECEGQIDELKSKLSEMERNKQDAIHEKSVIEDRLRQAKESKDLQAKRDKLQEDRIEVETRISKMDDATKEICSKRGYLAFASGALKKARDILEAKRARGEIPAGIKQQFVQDLLSRKRCICGTILEEGDAHYKEVASWLERSGNKQLEDKFVALAAGEKLMTRLRSEMYEELRRLRADRENELGRLEYIKEQLDEVSAKLDSKASEEVRGLERRRQELETTIRECEHKAGNYGGQIKEKESRLKMLGEEIRKKEALEAKARTAKNRMIACEEARKIIEKIHEILAHQVKDRLQAKINDVYKDLLRKGYIAKLDDNYTLHIVKEYGDTDRSVAMSQAERQIT